MAQHAPDQLLTPAAVAALAFVDPKTVSRWARAGKIPFETTPGGHRRFRRSDVEALLHQVRDHLPLEPALATPDARRAEEADAPAVRSIRSAAADAVVAEAVAIAMDAQAEAAAIEAAQARAVAAAEAARVVAHEAAAAAADMRSRATVQAGRLAEAATYARTLVSASDTDTDEHTTHAALQMAATVDAAAESASRDTAQAAARVAQAVTDAAAHVAERVADFERTLEREEPSTALALLKATLETARHAAQHNSVATRSAPMAHPRRLLAAAAGSPPAAAVVADAVGVALEAEVAAEQVLEIATAIVIAAETAAEAAAKARSTRAFAVAEAARIVSHDAAHTATALGERAEASAAFFAEEVKQALQAVASRESRDRDSGATLLAMRLLTTMMALAHASARDAASAAALAADAVAAAAAQLAAAEAAIDLAVEAEVSGAAVALRGVNLAAARRVAGATHARAADAAMAAREAAAVIRVEQSKNVDDQGEDLLAVASHELRAPLTSIAAYAEILQSGGGLTLEQTGFVDAIVRNAARLDVLTDDLLLLAGASSPLPQAELGEVDLRSVVASAEEVIATLKLRKHLQVSIELPSDPALVTGDAHQLERVVINLMGNAIKFTEDRGTVICRVSSTPADVFMTVADTGIGIPEAEQGRLFDRFFRGAGARGRAIRGTGLGLHIAATIIANHGGDISVDSVAGQGSVFTVRLPRRTMVG